MPPIRTVTGPIKPMKTERTHEENQERAYIAASRRSDRSLEARIESARRASEIHKKRTGRALRVTEQDVINEEMYEEEDDDMPSQYQRLSAHLHTNSLIFNRKLHDYIATQAAVRQTFYAQYNQPPFNAFGPAFPANVTGQQPAQTMNHFMNQQMPPPQGVNQTAQAFTQASQPYGQQFYRAAPYSIPARPQNHQRSASLSTPQQMSGYQQPAHFANTGVGTPQGEEQRRMSLPPQSLDQTPFTIPQTSSRPSMSRTTTPQTTQQANTSSQQTSPQHSETVTSQSPSSAHSTPTLHTAPTPGTTTPTGQPNVTSSFADNLPDAKLFSLSMPPESQQFIAEAMKPSDPMAAAYMQGSENIALPPTYHYNPNLTPKSTRLMSGGSDTSAFDSTLLPSAYSAFSGDEFGKMNSNSMSSVSMTNPSAVVSDDLISPADMTFASDFGIYGADLSMPTDNFDDIFNFDNES